MFTVTRTSNSFLKSPPVLPCSPATTWYGLGLRVDAGLFRFLIFYNKLDTLFRHVHTSSDF